MNDIKKTKLLIRKGINGFTYSVCNEKGYFIGNIYNLEEVQQQWSEEIRAGKIDIIIQLDKLPDLTELVEIKEAIERLAELLNTLYFKQTVKDKNGRH